MFKKQKTMKATKIMSIIGIVLAPISYLCIVAFNNKSDYEVGLGWGIIASAYLLALSIVALVQIKKVAGNK